ncbi:Hypothetical_protein [Hexamita inflata]|uniref:Hypothetical_protein n=1 Tax=Hexamita inflata TaxID=28002 RepID=A0AA86RQ48_9EUKA|nr:Hypothetical protein HINF_LOCUS66508 [Hexamita inflata]
MIVGPTQIFLSPDQNYDLIIVKTSENSYSCVSDFEDIEDQEYQYQTIYEFMSSTKIDENVIDSILYMMPLNESIQIITHSSVPELFMSGLQCGLNRLQIDYKIQGFEHLSVKLVLKTCSFQNEEVIMKESLSTFKIFVEQLGSVVRPYTLLKLLYFSEDQTLYRQIFKLKYYVDDYFDEPYLLIDNKQKSVKDLLQLNENMEFSDNGAIIIEQQSRCKYKDREYMYVKLEENFDITIHRQICGIPIFKKFTINCDKYAIVDNFSNVSEFKDVKATALLLLQIIQKLYKFELYLLELPSVQNFNFILCPDQYAPIDSEFGSPIFDVFIQFAEKYSNSDFEISQLDTTSIYESTQSFEAKFAQFSQSAFVLTNQQKQSFLMRAHVKYGSDRNLKQALLNYSMNIIPIYINQLLAFISDKIEQDTYPDRDMKTLLRVIRDINAHPELKIKINVPDYIVDTVYEIIWDALTNSVLKSCFY